MLAKGKAEVAGRRSPISTYQQHNSQLSTSTFEERGVGGIRRSMRMRSLRLSTNNVRDRRRFFLKRFRFTLVAKKGVFWVFL
jgi:hypothetical protein